VAPLSFRRRALPRASCGLVLAAALLPASAAAQAQPAETAPAREYQIKAVFLFNFAQFVEWPAEAFASEEAPLCFGVLGDDPFGAALESVVSGESVRGRKLIVRRARRAEDLEGCQLLFISRSERARLGEILAELEGAPVLTVSEIEGFGRRGGVINFYLEQNRVRFEINPEAAREDGLRISSELLNLGKIVVAEQRGSGQR
jgi:hypothetical protein